MSDNLTNVSVRLIRIYNECVNDGHIITLGQVRSSSRTGIVLSRRRFVCFWLHRLYYPVTYADIGIVIKHHRTTVYTACKTYDLMMNSDFTTSINERFRLRLNEGLREGLSYEINNIRLELKQADEISDAVKHHRRTIELISS